MSSCISYRGVTLRKDCFTVSMEEKTDHSNQWPFKYCLSWPLFPLSLSVVFSFLSSPSLLSYHPVCLSWLLLFWSTFPSLPPTLFVSSSSCPPPLSFQSPLHLSSPTGPILSLILSLPLTLSAETSWQIRGYPHLSSCSRIQRQVCAGVCVCVWVCRVQCVHAHSHTDELMKNS